MKRPHFFVAGVPATGKSQLGRWLAGQRGYIHIDAERDEGADLANAGIHGLWNDLLLTGRAEHFVAAINDQNRPVILDWGFPTRYLYVVAALQAEGIVAWWFNAASEMARQAFIARKGIPLGRVDVATRCG